MIKDGIENIETVLGFRWLDINDLESRLVANLMGRKVADISNSVDYQMNAGWERLARIGLRECRFNLLGQVLLIVTRVAQD